MKPIHRNDAAAPACEPNAGGRAFARSRRVLFAAAAVLIALPSCASPDRANPSVADAWQQPQTPASPPRKNDLAPSPGFDAASHAPADSAVAVATVNGRPIARDWLARALIASHGLDLLLQRMSLEVVRDEAARAKVSVTPADIDAEYDLTLKLGESGVPDRKDLTPERRKQLIEQWRTTRGVSAEELRLAMERQALLRRIATQRLTVNEPMLRDEFARIYGTKVECRHIVVASLRDAEKLRPFIDAGEDFAVLARRHSINDMSGAREGLLPPFTARDETVPGVLREAAFRMAPGQVSNPIKVDGQYHLLKLERRIPPDVVKFEAVRSAVERALRERRTPVEMEKLFTALQQQAALRIDDAELRRQYLDRLRDGRIAGPPLRD